MPRRGARSSDLPGADGLPIVLMLGVSQRTEHDSLLGGHRQRNLAARPDARKRHTPPSPGGREFGAIGAPDRH
jgi:hypothetical protein